MKNLFDRLKYRRNALDQFVMDPPEPKNMVDIFKGEWISSLPGNPEIGGSKNMFDDPLIRWYVEQLGGVRGKSVLELGPLEGAHSYMMEKAGAASILAIEASTLSFLKCLIVKELTQLKRVRFLLGDFVSYLRQHRGKFDVCLASGVLYHMTQPVELLALIAGVSDKICLWTHYYDRAVMSANPKLARMFKTGVEAEYGGFRHTLFKRAYDRKSLNSRCFCGGGTPYSHWMLRQDILSALEFLGFGDIRIGYEDPQHELGPAFGLVAMRGKP